MESPAKNADKGIEILLPLNANNNSTNKCIEETCDQLTTDFLDSVYTLNVSDLGAKFGYVDGAR